MEAIRKYATIDENGKITLEGLPFQNGDFVEILIFSTKKSNEELTNKWKVFFKEIQSSELSKKITDDDIFEEIRQYRHS